ncbi:MAG: gamma-glutamyltransferase [Cognatishimia sp.]
MRDFHKPGRSAVFAQNGMCATSHPLAAQVAIDLLKRGGTAMDAAIAGALVLGICEPQMTGIGGDCFVLFSPAGTDDIHAMNGSGKAPAAATANALRAQGHSTVPLNSPAAVTIPAAIDAFCQLSDRWGRLGLDALLEPAIRYAEDGIPVAPRVAFDWQSGADALQGAARNYYLKGDKPFVTGELFRAPGQAEVLRKVAKLGRDGFYAGDVMEDMLSTLNALGGLHTADDFANARADETRPIHGEYHDHELFEHPPNGQGATAILLLNILAQFNIASMDPFGAERAHIEAEATKLAYDTRNRFMADPDHMSRQNYMLSMDTARNLAALIDPKRAMPSATSLSESVHKDTVYITVVDRDGMSVSLIYSIFHTFGSGIATDKYGILFQNRGAGFTLDAGHPNELAGGKRPMHTIIPGILAQKGKPIMPFGVMGGQYQSTGHARLITNLLDFGMDPQTAIDAPRSFAEKGMLAVEKGYTPDVVQQLADLGHKITVPETPIGGAQAILMHESGVFEGASDPRKDGCALGY